MSDYVKRWFLVEYDGNIEMKEFECRYIQEHHGYSVKIGCILEFVPEAKVYATKDEAETRRKELLAELGELLPDA
jgi:hypothetical protein